MNLESIEFTIQNEPAPEECKVLINGAFIVFESLDSSPIQQALVQARVSGYNYFLGKVDCYYYRGRKWFLPEPHYAFSKKPRPHIPCDYLTHEMAPNGSN